MKAGRARDLDVFAVNTNDVVSSIKTHVSHRLLHLYGHTIPSKKYCLLPVSWQPYLPLRETMFHEIKGRVSKPGRSLNMCCEPNLLKCRYFG